MSAGSVRVLTGAALGAVFFCSGFALAHDPDAAQEMFDKGRHAMAREDYGTARAQFEASYAAEPAVGTLLNLAVCEEKSGLWTSAIQHLGQSLVAIGADDPRRYAASARRDELIARVPHLTLRVVGPLPAGLVVSLDETPIDPLSMGTALPIDPGRHSIRCQEAQAIVCSHEIVVHEQEALEWQIDLEPPPAVFPPPPAPPLAPLSLKPAPVRPRHAPPAFVYWTGGAGLASVALGLAAGAEVLALKETT